MKSFALRLEIAGIIILIMPVLMWKELMIKLLSNNFIRHLVNCGLRYILPQPVDMDIIAIFYLLLLSTGVSGFLSALPDNQPEEESEELPPSLMEAA